MKEQRQRSYSFDPLLQTPFLFPYPLPPSLLNLMPILDLVGTIIRPGHVIIVRDDDNILVVGLADHGLGNHCDGALRNNRVQESGPLSVDQLLDLSLHLVDALGGDRAAAPEALGDDVVARGLRQAGHHARRVVGAVDDVLARDAHAPHVVVHDHRHDVEVVPRVRVELLDVEPRRPVAVHVQHQRLRPRRHRRPQAVPPPVTQEPQVSRAHDGRGRSRDLQALGRPHRRLAAVEDYDGPRRDRRVDRPDRVVRVQAPVRWVLLRVGGVWRGHVFQVCDVLDPGLVLVDSRSV